MKSDPAPNSHSQQAASRPTAAKQAGSKSSPPKPPDSDVWYREGLRFECTQCGDCCTGAPGYVWVNQEEIDALAKSVGLEVAQFEKMYVRRVGVRKSLKEFPNGDCVLFDSETRKCTVYEARPRQCRTWPFWDSNLKNERAWADTCEVCPGSGKGPVYSLDEIELRRGVIKV